ncbi:hypothetical protein [Pseudoxanthomonas putridarboris]|uniref:Uncharacterized protein n=1 Tax=Pseudoxanthomonas putridarboris TaxID=752605 RepID=A0ABU9J294_9GAMM
MRIQRRFMMFSLHSDLDEAVHPFASHAIDGGVRSFIEGRFDIHRAACFASIGEGSKPPPRDRRRVGDAGMPLR